MNRKILLLGGTGAMGVYLREILAENGDNVFVTTRRNIKDEKNIHYIQGNAQDDDFLNNLLKTYNWDAIVDFMIYPSAKFRDRLPILLNGNWHYIFLSSYRVFADCEPLTETSPRLLDTIKDESFLKTDEYALLKARSENELFNYQKKNWTIVRPGITYSKERFQFGCLESDIVCYRSLANLPVVMPKEMLDKITTLTWGKDVARMIAGLICNQNAMGEAFNCGSAEYHTWREVAAIYKENIGMRVIECSVNEYINLCSYAQTMYDRMYNRRFDNSKILKVANITQDSLTKLKDGLSQELQSFKQNPHYKKFNLRNNVIIDNLTNTKLPFSYLKKLKLRQIIEYYTKKYPLILKFFRILKLNKFKKLIG